MKCWANVHEKWIFSVNFGLILYYPNVHIVCCRMLNENNVYFCPTCLHSVDFVHIMHYQNLSQIGTLKMSQEISVCPHCVEHLLSLCSSVCRTVTYMSHSSALDLSHIHELHIVARSRGYCPLLPGLVSCIYLYT